MRSMQRAESRRLEDEPDYLKELLAKAGIDAQAHILATNLQEVVIGELHHRVKNTLAIVSAITSQSIKSASNLTEAGKTIGDRLHALGIAQDLLIRERWTGAGCRTLVEGAVKAFQSKGLSQFEIAGDNIAISSGPAVSLSMVIHELCTNAVKYGALSVPGGNVSVSWTAADERFKLRWKESWRAVGPRANPKELRIAFDRAGATRTIARGGAPEIRTGRTELRSEHPTDHDAGKIVRQRYIGSTTQKDTELRGNDRGVLRLVPRRGARSRC